MDAALGPPEKMAENREELTPMMSQYFELCGRYDDSLVLFQVGDFYEAFCEAAETVARLLEITLTKREDSTGRYPMAGIPIDSAESYIETLLDAGYRIAVADQVQDPDEASGVVDRAVTRIVTPGTLTEDELLHTDDNNYVACLTRGASADGESGDEERADGEYGFALLDVSTGDFYATGTDSLSTVRDEAGRFAPSEAIVGPGVDRETADAVFATDCMVSPYERSAFGYEAAADRVGDYFGAADGLLASDAEVRACGALLAYAEYTRAGEDDRLDYLNHLTRYDPREYMLLDPVALRSLELFDRRSVHGDADATLVGVLDGTASALGSRELRDWLRRPLLDPERIAARHDGVEELVERVRDRERLHELLRDVYDIERLISRVSRGRADARDLRSLKATLDVVPDIERAMADLESGTLTGIRADLDTLEDVRRTIGDAIREDPPPEITEGGVIREGYSDDLDELRSTERDGKAWIDSLEERERERTGVDSLSVGYNEVHGYYIEVTNPNLDSVPEEYTRRQTLKNSERFYTPELKEREDEILRAEGRADDLEHRLFVEVRDAVAAADERVQALAGTLATLDALVALATVAAEHDYTRPDIVNERVVDIEAGRHPVVERTEPSFVPNGIHLEDDAFVAVITGPNMSGKSTYMRQVALAVIMAQAGSFVPARDARIGIVDRVFTRVGASDDIAGGRSTFMVEMTELAEILDHAGDRSLVLLDEVGRGTSTADGLAIARAVTEYLHDERGATTLFATHHHDLTAVAEGLPGVVNRHFSAEQRDGTVAFDHSVAPGPATASYGVEVAGEAGVPEAVVDRAGELLTTEADDGGASPADPETVDSHGNGHAPGTATTNGGNHDGDPDIADELRDLDVATTTPLEALEELARLKRAVEED